jgi:UDP-N-acetyl-D-glucosamine dehydrogenase
MILDKIQSKTAVVGIIGLGYVGLPLARAFTDKGFRTIGLDIDATKVETLARGESYIRHIGSDVVKEMTQSGLFTATTDFAELRAVDAIIICVPTPLSKYREPDLTAVIETGRSISRHLQKGQLVVLESSTYPGTTAEHLAPVLDESGLVHDQDYFLAYSPEREDPGNKTHSTATIPKIVGADTEASRDAATALYEAIISKIVPVSSTRTAEAIKITENVFRSVNIALVNELKVIYSAMGIDVWEVIEGAATKPFGFMPFYPGPGLGGHCIPIDPFYLTYKAREFEVPTRFIELAGEINTHMPRFVLDRVTQALSTHARKSLNGARILLIGLAYKKDVDDMRESPSLVLTELLEKAGAAVDYHDTFLPAIPSSRNFGHLRGRQSVTLSPETLKNYDLVLISTDHSDVDYQLLADHAAIVVDTRNAMHGLTGTAIVEKA